MKKRIFNLLLKSEFMMKIVIPYYSYLKRKRKLLKTIVPNLKKQLAYCDRGNNNPQPASLKILIPYIETSHYILYMMLILAKALQLRGTKIKFLYCAKTLNACEIINVHNRETNICRDCTLNQKHLLPLFKLDTCELSEYISSDKIRMINDQAQVICKSYPDSYYYYGLDLIPTVNDSVLRFYYGGEAKSEKELAGIRAQHLATAMISTEIARELHQTYKPDIILSLMFVYSSFQPYLDYYKENNIRTITIDMSHEDSNAIQCSAMEHYFSNDRFKAYLNSRKTKSLNQAEKEQLQKYMNNRFSGAALYFQTTGMFNNNVDPIDMLRIDRNRKNIFLFSNVFWDIGVSQSDRLYKNVIEWIMSTIDLIKDNEGCHLYIKPHPVERFSSVASHKSVKDYVYEKYRILPKNISIIDPELKINTYKLFPYIDMGVVYSGTLGLEMLLNDIPVVTVGKAPYGGLGFCYEPRTIDDYRNILLTDKIYKMTFDKELVYLFAYFNFIKRVIPFDIMKPVYGNNDFKQYNINSLEDLLPGRNYYLDHICDSILKNKPFECW
jgi:hypothetical protein